MIRKSHRQLNCDSAKTKDNEAVFPKESSFVPEAFITPFKPTDDESFGGL